ncbi:MAG: hypothetical protein GF417_06405 [Candidatus Latescibacteria bacterium]|nr:hypothetical protein [bacterium]MBD3424049.1 hypothetical protein [Candidatus Latescibacterota bacterium]
MLKLLRTKTKVILWVVIIAFVGTIFFAWGANYFGGGGSSNTDSRRNDIVGTVNGVEIPASTYSRNLTQLYSQMREYRGEEYTPGIMERYRLEDQAWEMTVNNILTRQKIEQLGITTTSQELVDFIRKNPHPSLREIFTDEEGNFDYQQYLNALADPNRDWIELENWARSELPRYKLESMLAAKLTVPEREVLEMYKDSQVEVKCRYVVIPVEMEDPPYQPGEEELMAKYEEMKDDLMEGEKRVISYVKLDYQPTARDFREVRYSLQEVRREIERGESDFTEAAKIYSEDKITADKGGNLGFFSRGEMPEELEETAFSLQPGEISEPVKTDRGYHLIRVEEKDQDRVNASHILMKVTPGYETRDSIRTMVTGLIDNIKSSSFEDAASDAGLEIHQSEPFTEGGIIQGIGLAPSISDFAFSFDRGDVSSAMQIDDLIYFVKIERVIPEQAKPFEEAIDMLVRLVREERAEQKAREKAADIRKESFVSSLQSAAEEHNLVMKSTGFFKKNEPVDGFPASSIFVKAAHILPPRSISSPIRGDGEFYLITVLEKTEPEMENYGEKRDSIANRLRRFKSQEVISDWFNELKKEADIVDLRNEPIS